MVCRVPMSLGCLRCILLLRSSSSAP